MGGRRVGGVRGLGGGRGRAAPRRDRAPDPPPPPAPPPPRASRLGSPVPRRTSSHSHSHAELQGARGFQNQPGSLAFQDVTAVRLPDDDEVGWIVGRLPVLSVHHGDVQDRCTKRVDRPDLVRSVDEELQAFARARSSAPNRPRQSRPHVPRTRSSLIRAHGRAVRQRAEATRASPLWKFRLLLCDCTSVTRFAFGRLCVSFGAIAETTCNAAVARVLASALVTVARTAGRVLWAEDTVNARRAATEVIARATAFVMLPLLGRGE